MPHRPFSPARRPSPKRFGWIFIYSLLAVAACAQERPRIAEEPLEIRAIRLELPDEEHSLEGSALRWLAGFDLEGDHQRFGGFSGLLVEGEELLAVSDRGWWWRGRLLLDEDGVLTGVAGDALWPIVDLDGGAVVGRDRHDAEELARHRGGLVVTFEGEHRLHWYGLREGRGEAHLPSAEPPVLLAGPPMEGVEENGGLEAVTSLLDGRLLALTEGGRTADGHIRAFLGSSAGSSAGSSEGSELGRIRWTEIAVQETEDFKPTAAATLPDGDVLLVERSFHPLRGVRIRLSKILLSELGDSDSADLVVPRELGRLVPPLPVDNLEAVDVTQTDGTTRIYLLADDNFRGLQDTLLIQLELLEPEDRP